MYLTYRVGEKNMPYKNKEDAIARAKRYYKTKSQYTKNYKLSKGCSICGYNECADALVFHHNGNKEVEVSHTHTLKRAKEEIKKCIVLCMNCHATLHSKLRAKLKPL